ncbi:MAG: hypothetical protein ACW981_00690 [Candidatus Hodarchaeales archaeon]
MKSASEDKLFKNEYLKRITHVLIKYMAYWVSGTKLIFISLLIIIMTFGDSQLQLYSLIVLILSILSFYWKLNPLMKKMDKAGQIIPEGYSKTLSHMIAMFVIVLSVAGILSIFPNF